MGLREALAGKSRYIAASRVSKHRVFVWLDPTIVPDDGLTIIPRDDDVTFGILQSLFHDEWGLRLLNRRGAGGDPRYAATQALNTFPFPEGLTPNIPASAYQHDPRAQAISAAARALAEARDRWLNPSDLVDRLPEVVPGFPDRLVPKDNAAALKLKTRTLTNLYNMRGTPKGTWLDTLHRTLDEAVAVAYGWPADITTDDALARLLALNHARAAA